jgi:uncharacterized protein
MKKIFLLFILLPLFSLSLYSQSFLEAVEAKNYELVEQQIKAGEKVNKTNKTGQFALWLAVWNGDTKMVDLLLKNGADASQLFKGKEHKSSCISIAAQEGHLEIAKLLGDAGANLDERGFVGHTPLRIACRNGHLELVKYFISKGCDVDSKGDDLATPLEHAASKGHLDIVKVLVESGADVNIQDRERDFPLGEAAKGGFIDVVSYLISKGADMSLKNQDGNNAQELARLAGQPKIVELIKKKMAE